MGSSKAGVDLYQGTVSPMKETGETINLMAKGQSAILMGHTMLENS